MELEVKEVEVYIGTMRPLFYHVLTISPFARTIAPIALHD
jgi:hypothetical protein